jgi:predicted AAA+ superfamily ATPase
LERLQSGPVFIALDEIHKYRHWRRLLKGFFDAYEGRTRVLVTGSASLAAFRRGGESLMGRYFPYTLHPISVAECAQAETAKTPVAFPARIDPNEYEALWQFGGFPEPFLKANQRFSNRWGALRNEQLFKEDVRDLTRIQELGQLEMLAALLRRQVGQLTSYAFLARSAQVSVDTVKRWTATLESLFYCFRVKPWHKNVARALRKEPKYYLWDWAQVSDRGARAENLVASALLKAVHWWTETGLGEFGPHFIRDKQKREVDFLVTRDRKPWFLAEVKSSAKASLAPSLHYFTKQTGAEHAFQVAFDAEYVDADCFSNTGPVIVPARTLLSQLV